MLVTIMVVLIVVVILIMMVLILVPRRVVSIMIVPSPDKASVAHHADRDQ